MIRTDGIRTIAHPPQGFAPAPTGAQAFDFTEVFGDDEVIALMGRIVSGLGVQLLYRPNDGQTFITITLNGATETFPVEPANAGDAFWHPYAYGATLPL